MEKDKILFIYSARDSDHLIQWGKRVIAHIYKSSEHVSPSKAPIIKETKKSHRLLLVPTSIFFLCFPLSAIFFLLKKMGFEALDRRFELECLVWRCVFNIAGAPKLLIAIEGSRALFKICRDFNIETFELQHGVFSNDRPAVGRAMSYFQKDGEPDNYVVWNKHSNDIVRSHSGKNIFEYSRSFGIDALHDKDIDILITLQWGLFDQNTYHPEPLHRIGLQNWVLDALKQLQLKGINLFFRLHPVDKNKPSGKRVYDEIKDVFGAHALANAINIESQDVMVLMRRSKCHITLYSSSVMEAAELGVPSIILDKECESSGSRYDYFSSYLQNGDAQIANSANISQILNKILLGK